MGRQAATREITGVLSRAYGSYKKVKDAVKKDALVQRDIEQRELDQRKRGLDRHLDRDRDTYLRDIRTRAAKGEFVGESIRTIDDILFEYDRGNIHGKRGVTRRTRDLHAAKAFRSRKKRREGAISQPHGGKREKTPPRRPRRKDPDYYTGIDIPTRSTKYDRYNLDDPTDYDDTYYGKNDRYKPDPKKPEKEYRVAEIERQRGKKLRRSRDKPTKEYTHDRYEPYKPKRKPKDDKYYEAMGQRPRRTQTMVQKNAVRAAARPTPKPVMKPMSPTNSMQERSGYGDHYEKEKTSLGKKLKKVAGSIARATGADELKGVPGDVHRNVKHQFVHKFLLR